MADEAVSALDVSVQAQVLNLMMDLQDELGLITSLSPTTCSVVNQISNRYRYVRGGVAEIGPPQALFKDPKHPYTAALITSLPADLQPQRPPDPEGEVANPANPPSGCHLITLRQDAPGDRLAGCSPAGLQCLSR
ncbi:MAG: ABC transporter ATP-binding protein [Caldilineaceae bacterium]|nr:ABC transporter ATP-binding protein [Caldilineaceae bacterium]